MSKDDRRLIEHYRKELEKLNNEHEDLKRKYNARERLIQIDPCPYCMGSGYRMGYTE